MSDAQRPPTFDEMVGLIKKLFTDYLEDVIKSKPSEIEKSWERYKTLNHLYQDEKQPGLQPLPEPLLTDEDVKDWEADKREQGKLWIKASDRLPGYETPVKWRDGKDHSHATDGKIPLIHMAKPFLTGWEWYDEGTAAGREDDAVAFAEWAIRNATVTSTYDGWIYGSKRYTTAELYDIFKQQKEK